MPALFLPRRWRQPPSYQVALDRAHPLAQDLVFASNGAQMHDVVRGRRATWSGTPGARSASGSVAPLFSSSSGLSYPNDALLEPAALTVIAHAQRTGAGPGFNRIVSKENSSIGFWTTSFALLQHADTADQFVGLVTVSGSVKNTGNLSVSAAVIDRPFSLAMTFDVAIPGPLLYLNGALGSQAFNTGGAVSYNSDLLYVGNNAALNAAFVGCVNGASIYSRALSAAEIAELSVTVGNPWQIYRRYAPKTYFFPTAGGGATGTFAAATRRNTLAASGTVNPVTGTLAATTRRDTLSASGQVTSNEATGTIAAATRRDTMAAAGTVNPVTGTLAATTRRDTMAASGTVSSNEATGTIAMVTRRDTLNAAGIVNVITGTFAAATRRNTMAAFGVSGNPPRVGGVIVNAWPFDFLEDAA